MPCTESVERIRVARADDLLDIFQCIEAGPRMAVRFVEHAGGCIAAIDDIEARAAVDPLFAAAEHEDVIAVPAVGVQVSGRNCRPRPQSNNRRPPPPLERIRILSAEEAATI